MATPPLSVAVPLALALSGCIALGAHGEPDAVSPTVTSEEPESARPVAGNPAEMMRCLTACSGGEQSILAFCRSIPDARIKGACWAFVVGTLVACNNFCYRYWGS